VRIGPEGLPQRRNLGLQVLDDPVRPYAPHQRVFADDGSARLDQRHQRIEGAPAELDRRASANSLRLRATTRKCPNAMLAGASGAGSMRRRLWEVKKFEFFWAPCRRRALAFVVDFV
jgi:hypothetical protein